MSRLWNDTLAIPAAIRATLAAKEGVDEVLAVLGQRGTGRIVISGNGAAWYVGLAVWLAGLESIPIPVPLISVPAGLMAQGRFRWQPGDVLLVISTSGEMRDLIEALESNPPGSVVAITGSPQSTIARRADAVAVTHLLDPGAFSHSQSYAANLVLALRILAEYAGDQELGSVVESAGDVAERAIADSEGWPERSGLLADGVRPPRMVTVFGSGPGWAAALEAALLVREVARLPSEGTETREAVTSSMFGMGPEDLAVGLPTEGDDYLIGEAEELIGGTGATVLRAPGSDRVDRRLAPLTAFPASVRLAISLAELQELDPDTPEAAATYYRTARKGGT